jgi:CDP-glucose 4,6-dehydratase
MELKDNPADRFAEAGLLKLSCDKALSGLCWRPVLKLSEALSLTANWYQKFYAEPEGTNQLSESQLMHYCSLAKERNLVWV